MSNASNENTPGEHEEHHSESEGSEELGKHSDHSEEENKVEEETKGEDESPKHEEIKLEHAHGDVNLKGKKEKGGYAQVNDTQTFEDESHTLDDDMVKGDNPLNKPIKPQTQAQPQGVDMNQAPVDMRQKMMQENPENLVNVLQCCLDGSFKPFLACVQMGFVDKNFIVDHQIGRRVIHLIAHFGNIKAMRVMHEILKADITAKDYQGLNAVHYAAGSGEIETLKYL